MQTKHKVLGFHLSESNTSVELLHIVLADDPPTMIVASDNTLQECCPMEVLGVISSLGPRLSPGMFVPAFAPIVFEVRVKLAPCSLFGPQTMMASGSAGQEGLVHVCSAHHCTVFGTWPLRLEPLLSLVWSRCVSYLDPQALM